MIPYDDLVVALQNWRARQGLPVAQLSSLAPPPAAIASTPPPPPPGKTPGKAPGKAPAAVVDDDIEAEGLLEEAHYENEGNDFAMAFGQSNDDESTSIGGAPSPGRDSFSGGGTEPEPKGGRNNDDW